jgi:protein ImuA
MTGLSFKGVPMQLDQLLASRADLWRGHDSPRAAPTGLPSGFQALDAALAGGGWPGAGLSEVLTQHQGAGLALLLPLLARLSAGPRWLLWVDPPHVPFAPALAAHGLDLTRILLVRAGTDAAWAAEQGLRSGTCAAVLAWTGPVAGAGATRQTVRQAVLQSACWTPSALRRLQLAAADTGTPMLLLRPLAAAGETSPAALRLKVSAHADGLDVGLLKQRGGRPGQRLRLPPPLIEPPAGQIADVASRRAGDESAAAVARTGLSPRRASQETASHGWPQHRAATMAPSLEQPGEQQQAPRRASEWEPVTTPRAAALGNQEQAVVGADTTPLASARHVRRRRAAPGR